MLRDDFQSMMETVQNDSRITVEEFSNGDSGLSMDTARTLVEGISQITSIPLTDEFVEYIHLGEGFYFFWNSNEGITGEFSLVAIQHVLMKTDDSQLWHDEMSISDKEFYKSLQTIDIHSLSGSGQYTAISMKDGEIPNEIWYINVDARFKMKTDYGQYLEALLETRGLHGWQYFYLDDYSKLASDEYDLNRAKPLMKNTIHGLKMLFPDVNIDRYLNIYIDLFNENI